MNKERILALAELIENQPHEELESEFGFNMEDFTHPCGTPSCIAGWAVFQAGGLEKDYHANSKVAAEILGLEHRQAEDLFFAWRSKIGLEEITPFHAAATLRHLAETGDVDWDATAPQSHAHTD